MFWASSQTFPDLKNHIGLHCWEEGPNQDAELTSEAASATAAEPWPHQAPVSHASRGLVRFPCWTSLLITTCVTSQLKVWARGLDVLGPLSWAWIQAYKEACITGYVLFCFLNFWREKRLLFLPRNSPKHRKKLQMLGSQNGQGTLRSQKGCPGSTWEKGRQLWSGSGRGDWI